MICLALLCCLQAVISSKLNSSSDGFLVKWLQMVFLGLGISSLWVFVSKFSTNLIRDGLIWDIVIGMSFSYVLIHFGHGDSFSLKHWVGVGFAFITFVYWAVIK
jgi:hypothetical protein